MIEARTVMLILSKEVREARRNTWFLLFAVIFSGLSLTVSLLGLAGLGSLGVAGFGRTTASLLNLVVLIVPLMGLLFGALEHRRRARTGNAGDTVVSAGAGGGSVSGQIPRFVRGFARRPSRGLRSHRPGDGAVGAARRGWTTTCCWPPGRVSLAWAI